MNINFPSSTNLERTLLPSVWDGTAQKVASSLKAGIAAPFTRSIGADSYECSVLNRESNFRFKPGSDDLQSATCKHSNKVLGGEVGTEFSFREKNGVKYYEVRHFDIRHKAYYVANGGTALLAGLALAGSIGWMLFS